MYSRHTQTHAQTQAQIQTCKGEVSGLNSRLRPKPNLQVPVQRRQPVHDLLQLRLLCRQRRHHLVL